MTEHEHHPAQPDQDGPATDEATADGPASDGTGTPDVATATFGAGDEPVDAPVADDPGADGTGASEAAAVQADDTSDTADTSDPAAADAGDDRDDTDTPDGAEAGPAGPSFEALVAGEPATEPVAPEPMDEDADEPADEPVDEDADEPVDEPVVEQPAPVVLSGPPSQRLVQLGIALPQVPAPVADYVPAVRSGAHVYTSGQLPFFDGQLTTTGVVGDEAVDVTPEEAALLARQCALNAIAAVASVVDLDSVVRVVKVTGFVASAPGFAKQPVVVNGASALIGEVFGEAGKHARSAVGVAALPLGAPVEVELVVEVA